MSVKSALLPFFLFSLTLISCSPKVSNSYNAVTLECGQIDLPEGYGVLKLSSPTQFQFDEAPFDVFSIGDVPLRIDLSEKLCIPVKSGARQLVKIGSNSLNLYFMNWVTIIPGAVTPAALQTLESREFSMACSETVYSKGISPFQIGPNWELAGGLKATFGLVSLDSKDVLHSASHHINQENQLMLMMSNGIEIPEGQYALTGMISHGVLDRTFQVKGIENCKLIVDRKAPDISLPSFGLSSEKPSSEIKKIKFGSDVSIDAVDNFAGGVDTAVRLLKIVGAEKVLVKEFSGTKVEFPEAGTYVVETSSTDKAGNTAKLTAYFDVDSISPSIILPERREYRSGESIEILVSGADTMYSCISEPNGDPCSETGAVLTTYGGDGANSFHSITSMREIPGKYFILISATDLAGNSTGAIEFPIIIDNVAPSLTFPDVDQWNSGIQAVKFVKRELRFPIETDDPSATVTCSVFHLTDAPIDCQAIGNRIEFDTFYPEFDMTYVVTVTVTDVAGNATSSEMMLVYSAERTFFEICNNPNTTAIAMSTLRYLTYDGTPASCDSIFATLSQLTSFWFPPSVDYVDLGVFADFKNIVYWQLSGVKVHDGAGFARLKVRVVEAGNSTLNYITGLTRSGELERLDIGSGMVTDYLALSNMPKLESLSGSYNERLDLVHSGIKLPASLKVLDISGTRTSDLTIVSHLTKMYRLIADDNGISDLSPLRALHSLEDLRLKNNAIRDIEPLSGLVNLITLGLDGSPVASTTAIANLPITTLALQGTHVDDSVTIPETTKILQIRNNSLKSLNFITERHKIDYLMLDGNDVVDLSPLRHIAGKLRRLEYASHSLTKDSTPVDLTGFTLAPFPNLEYLDLSTLLVNDLTPLKALESHVHVKLDNIRNIPADKCPTDAGPISVRQFCLRAQADHGN